MIYTVNPHGMNSYNVCAQANVPLDSVWISQKYLFVAGTWVTIANESGNQKTYIKE